MGGDRALSQDRRLDTPLGSEVSREDFWQALRDRTPVDRPRPRASAPPEHDAWVLAVLTRDLHLTVQQIAALDVDTARSMVLAHWSKQRGW